MSTQVYEMEDSSPSAIDDNPDSYSNIPFGQVTQEAYYIQLKRPEQRIKGYHLGECRYLEDVHTQLVVRLEESRLTKRCIAPTSSCCIICLWFYERVC